MAAAVLLVLLAASVSPRSIGGSVFARLDALHVRGGRGSLAWTADGRSLGARCAELVVLEGVKHETTGTWSVRR